MKGLYSKARSGAIKDFTGIGSNYEVPDNSEITLNTGTLDVEQCVERILQVLVEKVRVAKKGVGDLKWTILRRDLLVTTDLFFPENRTIDLNVKMHARMHILPPWQTDTR